jgi:7,8-didemethyl-8-hydroxy-5-deazariboflavin synthase
VNPEFSWPPIETVEKNCANAGFNLRARLPVYPEFISFVNRNLMERIYDMVDFAGFVKKEYLV